MTAITAGELRDFIEENGLDFAVECNDEYFTFRNPEISGFRPIYAFPVITEDDDCLLDLSNVGLTYNLESLDEALDETEDDVTVIEVEDMDELLWEVEAFDRNFGDYR